MTAKPRPYSIRIYLPDGSPDGLRIVEKSNWTGAGLVCPRALLSGAKNRAEFTRTGVYVLSGPAAAGELPMVYVGEGDPVRPRLEQHATKKDFWTSVVIFTSKDGTLNKAHVQYLEARLLELARDARRCELENGNAPQRPSLSEAEEAEIETFLSEMLLCFPVIGLNVFERPEGRSRSAPELALKAKGICASGYESGEGFVVLAGSQAVLNETPSIHEYMSALRRNLVKNGVLTVEGNAYRLAQDYVFASPSTAAGVLLGRPSNGRVDWKAADGRSLKELQEEKLNAGKL